MSRQSVIPEGATIGKVIASPGCGMHISITWSSSGGISYGLNRQLTATIGVHGFVPTPIVPANTQPVRSSATDVVPDTRPYTYTVMVWDSPTHSVSRNSNSVTGNPHRCPRPQSGFFIQSTIDTFESQKGSFELLIAQGACIKHYTHKKGSILTGHWKHVNTLYAPEGGAILDNAVSLVQTASGNFVAVVVVTPLQDVGQNYLVSYEFHPESGWGEPSILKADGQTITDATGIPALIQTQEGSYQLFVPQRGSIGRFMHPEGSIQNGTWMPLPPFGSSDTSTYTAISAMQTDLDQIELIARVTPAQTPQRDAIPDYLDTFVARSVDPQAPFDQVGPLLADGQPINGVTGGASFIQKNGSVFELIVPVGDSMNQYIQETASIDANLWKHVSTLKQLKNDPGIQFTATSLIESDSGKLALVAVATPPQGEGNPFPVTYQLTGWEGPRRIPVDGTSGDEDHDRDKQDHD